MGGEQAAGVLAQISQEQRSREGKPVRSLTHSVVILQIIFFFFAYAVDCRRGKSVERSDSEKV